MVYTYAFSVYMYGKADDKVSVHVCAVFERQMIRHIIISRRWLSFDDREQSEIINNNNRDTRGRKQYFDVCEVTPGRVTRVSVWVCIGRVYVFLFPPQRVMNSVDRTNLSSDFYAALERNPPETTRCASARDELNNKLYCPDRCASERRRRRRWWW